MAELDDSPQGAEINAALFCHFTEGAFLSAALQDRDRAALLVSDDAELLAQVPEGRRCPLSVLGFDRLPIEPEDVYAKLRERVAALDAVETILIDMTWSLAAMLGVNAIEAWGTVAEQAASDLGVTVVSIYNQDRMIEEQLQAALRAHQQFLAPSGLYENPYWLPRELLTASTLDEQLGFMLGRVVPDFAGQTFFRTFDKAAARGASPHWLDEDRATLGAPSARARWHIHCLGQLRVFVDGHREVDWRTKGGAPKKSKTLFAYLLNAGEKGAHADQISELLWPDLEAEQTKRARLHHTVAMVRKVLGSQQSITRNGDYYRLNVPDGSLIDITAFEQLCRRGLSLARHGQEDLALPIYFEAERLYAGDLFEDLPLEYLATETEDWIMPRRTWLREMAMRLHFDLSKLLRKYRRYGEALAWAQKAVAIDPTSEAANAEAMRVFHAMGRPDAMHRQFRQYRTALTTLGEAKEGVEIRAVYDELCRSLDRLSLSQRKTKELVLR